MIWTGVAVVAIGAYLFKLAGLTIFDASSLPEPVATLARQLPIALFAALVVVNTVAEGTEIVIDARLAGVAVGGLAAWKKAPFLVVVAAAMATTSALRWAFYSS